MMCLKRKVLGRKPKPYLVKGLPESTAKKGEQICQRKKGFTVVKRYKSNGFLLLMTTE